MGQGWDEGGVILRLMVADAVDAFQRLISEDTRLKRLGRRRFMRSWRPAIVAVTQTIVRMFMRSRVIHHCYRVTPTHIVHSAAQPVAPAFHTAPRICSSRRDTSLSLRDTPLTLGGSK